MERQTGAAGATPPPRAGRATGDADEALASFFERTGDRAYGLALRVLGGADGAADTGADACAEVTAEAYGQDDHGARTTSGLLARVHRGAVERLRSQGGVRHHDIDPGADPLELAYFGGLTHTQVDTALGWSPGTAKRRIREALLALRPTGLAGSA